MNTEFTIRDHNLTLLRYPKVSNETLQAWDAGDEYLINHVEALALPEQQNILIVNDSFGALSCWFSQRHNVTMMTDSYISQRGTLRNLQRNQCGRVAFINCLDAIPEHIDLVLLKIPKSNRLLTWQLHQLRMQLPAECPVIAVNKVRDLHTSTLNLFEKYLGTTTTSLAKKKYRLVFSLPDVEQIHHVDDITRWPVEGEEITLNNHANVYSGESLDLGARFLLKHIPQEDDLRHIIDLGCGNGVLGIKAAQLNPEARITCIDESYMAVESATLNLEENLGPDRRFQVLANNCLDGFKEHSCYLILCNPPFHQQQAITDHIAWQMFCDAKKVLAQGGSIMVIGNNHLEYDQKLGRLFGDENVNIVARNSKFVILKATKAIKT
ncbi:methyltransferase [Aliivibrio kagoshimensis]|uniref:methyltransferase n=1 Tax=Aliivibrio kagoshimensis TaxID=2910230 RepID=UPI003D0B4753